MKKSLIKKLTVAIGFLAMVFIFTVIPGTEADAAATPLKLNGEAELRGKGTHLIKMERDGYIAFAAIGLDENVEPLKEAVQVQLYNKSKKPISYTKSINAYSKDSTKQEVWYAVKRGYYYIKISGNANYYVTVAKGTALTEKSGSKKSKAVTIQSKKYRKGLVMNTDSKKKYDWYKFTLKKKSKVFISGVLTDTNLEMKVYSSAKVSKKTQNAFVKGKKVTMPKGTYYIKVGKKKTYSGGAYAIGVNYVFKGKEL